MNHDRRDRREDIGVTRGAGQRTPRSGGRTVAQRTWRGDMDAPGVTGQRPVRGVTDPEGRALGARDLPDRGSFPTQGSAALRADRWTTGEPDERAVRVWDSSAEPDPIGGDRSRSRADRPRLRVAPPPLPVAVPRAPFTALILALVVGGVLGILVINTKINENSFRQQRLQDQQAALDLQQQRLEKEIAAAEAPGNLAAQARKLGLVDPGPPAFIRLPDGQVIGVPQPAAGAPAVTSSQAAGG